MDQPNDGKRTVYPTSPTQKSLDGTCSQSTEITEGT